MFPKMMCSLLMIPGGISSTPLVISHRYVCKEGGREDKETKPTKTFNHLSMLYDAGPCNCKRYWILAVCTFTAPCSKYHLSISGLKLKLKWYGRVKALLWDCAHFTQIWDIVVLSTMTYMNEWMSLKVQKIWKTSMPVKTWNLTYIE